MHGSRPRALPAEKRTRPLYRKSEISRQVVVGENRGEVKGVNSRGNYMTSSDFRCKIQTFSPLSPTATHSRQNRPYEIFCPAGQNGAGKIKQRAAQIHQPIQVVSKLGLSPALVAPDAYRA